MKLDNFDREVLDASGDASELMFKFYQKKIKRNNAEKQMAGIRTHLRFKEKMSVIPEREIGELEETVIKADGTITTKRLLALSEEESKDPKRIMELMGFDVLQWKLVSCKVRRNYWDVSMKLHMGYDDRELRLPEQSHKVTNHAFECTVSVKPIQDLLSTDMIVEVFNALPAPELIEYEYVDVPGMLLEVPIQDLHLGKLAWKEEIGHNYNIKIAKRLYKQAITQFLEDIHRHSFPVEEIVLPIGQDFFHMDTAKHTTTAGTPMDSDTRWPKMFEEGKNLIIWAVENLRKIAPVKCIYIASNHDEVMSFCLAQTIHAWYRNCENVSVDTHKTPRKYIKWGKCLIGMSHGSDESKRIEQLMQAENPKQWGNTVFREWHLAHLHSEQVKEIPGVIVRHMSSITSLDKWHKDKGFMALRKAQAILWDKELGKRFTIDVNVTAGQ